MVGGGFNVDGAPRGIHPVSLPPGGSDQPFGERARADADQQTFPCSPRARDGTGLHVRKHLVVDPFCGPAEGKFPQGIQVALVEELLDGPGCHVGNVDLSLPQPLEEFRGCKVDQFDLGRFIDHPVGNCLPDNDTGDLGNDIVEALDMLDIQRCIDIDPCIEEFLDILVTFRVAGTRGIGVGQFIDKHELRVGREDCIEVHFRKAHIPVFHHLPGDDGKPFCKRFCLGPAMGLNVPDPYVNAFTLPEVGCLEHLVGFSHTRDVSQENFQFAPVLLPLLVLHTGEEDIGIRTIFRIDDHGCGYTPISTSSISIIFIPMNGAISPPIP